MEKIPGPHHAGHRCSQQIIGFIKERIQMQQALLDPCAPQNYIDCFLAKMEQVMLLIKEFHFSLQWHEGASPQFNCQAKGLVVSLWGAAAVFLLAPELPSLKEEKLFPPISYGHQTQLTLAVCQLPICPVFRFRQRQPNTLLQSPSNSELS